LYSAPSGIQKSDEMLNDLIPNLNSDGTPSTCYEKCVRRLYLTNMFHPVKMGLQNMIQLHECMGNPMTNRNVVHIAGTNGKGSVSLKIAKTLEHAGHTVGLFVSPHVSTFRERMQINGTIISEQQVEELLPQIYNICETEEIPATFFEVTTALAFWYFAKNNCDVVVLETGLGGRLDATNILTKPDLCVITSIGLEHTRILGNTIEEIAGEKAGIIKKGVPVLVGPNAPHDVIRTHAEQKGADKMYSCQDVLGTSAITNDDEEYVDYDVENSKIATAALHLLRMKKESNFSSSSLLPITDESIQKGTSYRPPCRFEEMSYGTNKGIQVVLDVAHNPSAMDHLSSKLKVKYPLAKKRIVAGFSSDKDLSKCGQSLLDMTVQDPSCIHLVEAAHPRAAALKDIVQAQPQLQHSNLNSGNTSIKAQVKLAIQLAQENEEMLVICGSVFIMSEAREMLGIDEPRDSKYIAEVAGSGMRNFQENFADRDPEEVA